MAVKIKLEVMNLAEVRKALEELGPRAEGVLPKAVEAGAEELRDRMAAKGPGDGIGTEERYNGGGRVIYYVGPLKEKFYYAFFETGTSAHLVKPRSARALHWGDTVAARAMAGGIAPAPFMRPAVDEGKDAVAAKVGEVIRESIE